MEDFWQVKLGFIKFNVYTTRKLIKRVFWNPSKIFYILPSKHKTYILAPLDLFTEVVQALKSGLQIKVVLVLAKEVGHFLSHRPQLIGGTLNGQQFELHLLQNTIENTE